MCNFFSFPSDPSWNGIIHYRPTTLSANPYVSPPCQHLNSPRSSHNHVYLPAVTQLTTTYPLPHTCSFVRLVLGITLVLLCISPFLKLMHVDLMSASHYLMEKPSCRLPPSKNGESWEKWWWWPVEVFYTITTWRPVRLYGKSLIPSSH